VVDDAGNAYVNNIGFDFPEAEFARGIVVLVEPDGTVTPVADGLAFPNGMAISADGSDLIVAESYAERLTAFDIAADGTLSGRWVWALVRRGLPCRRLRRERATLSEAQRAWTMPTSKISTATARAPISGQARSVRTSSARACCSSDQPLMPRRVRWSAAAVRIRASTKSG
jgi:hypothetical protein